VARSNLSINLDAALFPHQGASRVITSALLGTLLEPKIINS
jgi:hypothetical protein